MFFTSMIEHWALKTVLKVVAFPVSGPKRAGSWMLEKIHEEVRAEEEDEERVMSKLTELQLLFELGEIEEEEYEKQERLLLEDMSAIREAKKDEEFEPAVYWWTRVFPEAGEERRPGWEE